MTKYVNSAWSRGNLFVCLLDKFSRDVSDTKSWCWVSCARESTFVLTVLNPWFQLLEQFGWCLLCLSSNNQLCRKNLKYHFCVTTADRNIFWQWLHPVIHLVCPQKAKFSKVIYFPLKAVAQQWVWFQVGTLYQAYLIIDCGGKGTPWRCSLLNYLCESLGGNFEHAACLTQLLI